MKNTLHRLTVRSTSWLSGMIVAIIFALSAHAAGDNIPQEAYDWLVLLDNKQYQQSYEAAAPLFKQATTALQWQAAAEQARGSLGAFKSRKVASAQRVDNLPGLPTGEYQVIDFHSSFALKNAANERLVLVNNEEGWQTIGYFVR
ncbi:DUF4019 domain-containing protein [Alteromonas oceanisediminis]|uniref:DUF4019 domain-containing protein n=1 Tax=Alteromonas oceanisediminis TaxID=2836180 RepID=UPI001BDAD97B|nr:DUF4019 domain-containing protein [Alteromonas oceanisediminis]MBT0586468.1 DUF4019 domain-containing protein [Alteromonas oceanisediminis]